MQRIQFVTDEAGKPTAVLISLDEWGELWKDIYDILISESRRDEPAAWEDLKAELVNISA